jgi:hypothetical protein
METEKHHLTDKINALDSQIEENNDSDAIPKLKNNFFWIISGGAGSGKTTMLLNLLQIKHKEGGLGKFYKKIYLISPTHRLDNKLEDLVEELGPEQTYSELNDNTIQSITNDIKNTENFKKEHFLIIMDDCLGMMPNIMTKSKAHTMLISRRHLHATVICLVQSYVRIPNLWRRNANLISFFGTQNKKEIQSLIDDVNGDEELLRMVIEDATEEPHSFLTIKLNSGKPIFYKKFNKYLL